MSKTSQQQLLMYAAFFIMIVINILANVIPFNKRTTGEVANLYHVLLVPSGYTFMIWGLIYIGLLVWLISFSLKKQSLTLGMCITFISSCLLNITWLFLWHYLFYGAALIVIALHFISIFSLYLLQRHQHETKWLRIPISLYFGWLTVALMINIMYYLVAVGNISFVSQLSYSYLALCIIVILGLTIFFLWKDLVVQIVFCWSFIGIISKNIQMNLTLSIVTMIFTVFLIGATVFLTQKPKSEQTL